MAEDRAHSTLAFLLSQVGIHASQRFAQRLAALDLLPPQFRVMNAIDAKEGSSQQAIGAAIGAPPSRMVAIVDELEARGLLERRPDLSDRRVRALHLTAAGRKLLARARKLAAEHEEDLAQGLSPADRKRLVALLQKLVEQQEIGAGVHPGLSGSEGR